jgi:RNA polymerase sigma-70 factor (ECF subfamily)
LVPAASAARSFIVSGVDRASRLAIAARDGDGDALAMLVRATYEPVWRFSAATAGPAEADDIAQETFERALRSLGSYRGDAPVTTWLIGIARHVHLDRIRRHARTAAPASRSRDIVVHDSSARVELADVVARLDNDRRDAFVLTQVMGFRYEEAAAICGCPTGTIRSRVARARADLMAMLDEQPPRSATHDPH